MRPHTGESGAWGLAYYSRGELLQRVEPKKQGEPLDIAQYATGIRADIFFMHSRNPTVGTVRSENIHPFRFKDWTFVHNGTIGGFEGIREQMCHSMPPFILRGIRGDTDSEHIFHLFLSFIYDAGLLGRPDPGIALIRDALSRAIATVDELSARDGIAPSKGSFMVSDGYSMVALSRGVPVDYLRVEGVTDCAVCRPSQGSASETGIQHADLLAVLVRSDASQEAPPPGFQRLKDNSFLMVTRSHEVEFSAFV